MHTRRRDPPRRAAAAATSASPVKLERALTLGRTRGRIESPLDLELARGIPALPEGGCTAMQASCPDRRRPHDARPTPTPEPSHDVKLDDFSRHHERMDHF